MVERRTPAVLVPPGRILRRELEERGWTQKDLAAVIGRPEQTISAIIRGTKQITPETAIALGRALGTSAQLWMNLESNYRLGKASHDAQADEIERRRHVYELVPVRELVRRGWIREVGSIDDLESEVCSFLGIENIGESPVLAASFRGTEGKSADSPSCLAWLKRVESLCRSRKLAPYSKERLQSEGISSLQQLTADVSGISAVSKTLARFGIAFACVPHLPKTYLDGAAFHLPSGAPVVALTLRHDRIDAFWFTLFHEVSHIVFGHGRAFLDRMSATDDSTKEESTANRRAASWLISQVPYARYVAAHRPYFSEKSIRDFAGTIGRHPGLVLGRLQRDGLVPYKNLRKLLPRVRSHLLI